MNFDLSKLQIIYEDNHLIAINKPAGTLVQGDETGDKPLSDFVKQYIRLRYNKPGEAYLGVCHRLDRPVSGALIFARTSKALERMNELFATQKIEKTYWAITHKRPEPFFGHLEHWLLKDPDKNVTKAYDAQSNRNTGAKLAILDYEMLGDMEGMYLIKVNPKTGRPHQIRVQLAKMGCPISGDVKYGAAEPLKDASIHLHCHSMKFMHPIKKEMIEITAEPPISKATLWKRFEGIYE